MTRKQIEQKAKEEYPDEPIHTKDEFTRMMRQSFLVLFRKCFVKGAEFALSHQWVSVEDEMPPQMGRYSQYVIMLNRVGGHYIGCYDFVAKKWLDGHLEDVYMDVTHWMPIPPMAEEGGKDETI